MMVKIRSKAVEAEIAGRVAVVSAKGTVVATQDKYKKMTGLLEELASRLREEVEPDIYIKNKALVMVTSPGGPNLGYQE